MTDKTWHSGPPPSVGWWPASITGIDGYLSWWNGKFWSLQCLPEHPQEVVAWAATRKSVHSDLLKWQHRPASWP